MVGFEDGSVRMIRMEDGLDQLKFHVINVMKPQLSWFDNTPIRSILTQRSNDAEFAIFDEVRI